MSAAFKECKKGRKHLSEKTLYDYDCVLRVALKNWLLKSVIDITPDMVRKRFYRITKERAETCANLTMRTLRAILNYANEVFNDRTGNGLFIRNPVAVLTRTRRNVKSGESKKSCRTSIRREETLKLDVHLSTTQTTGSCCSTLCAIFTTVGEDGIEC